jgi:hypothetical protein
MTDKKAESFDEMAHRVWNEETRLHPTSWLPAIYGKTIHRIRAEVEAPLLARIAELEYKIARRDARINQLQAEVANTCQFYERKLKDSK